MNINGLNAGLSYSPDEQPDPLPGNTTVGSGKLTTTFFSIYSLVATQAVTQEERTLPDPQNAGLGLTLVLRSTAGANLRVTANTKINVAGQTHILFTAVDQVVILQSVPISGTPIPKYRWEVVLNDGTSLS